ncbi:hypothetical protein ABK040_005929 [Willaertia magna]
MNNHTSSENTSKKKIKFQIENPSDPNYKSITQKSNYKEITFEEMSKYFHLPQTQAAELLGVSLSTLKRRFYSFGIGRWPSFEGTSPTQPNSPPPNTSNNTCLDNHNTHQIPYNFYNNNHNTGTLTENIDQNLLGYNNTTEHPTFLSSSIGNEPNLKFVGASYKVTQPEELNNRYNFDFPNYNSSSHIIKSPSTTRLMIENNIQREIETTDSRKVSFLLNSTNEDEKYLSDDSWNSLLDSFNRYKHNY